MPRKPTFFEFLLSLITCQVWQPDLNDDKGRPDLKILKEEGKMREYFLKKYELSGEWVKDGVTYTTDNMFLVYAGMETHRPGRMSLVPQDFFFNTAIALWKHKNKGTFFKIEHDDNSDRSYIEILSESEAKSKYLKAQASGTVIIEKSFEETFGYKPETY